MALGTPLLAALTLAGTYLGKEIIVFALFLAVTITGVLFVRPVIGVMVMTAAYILAAYPTVLQTFGPLTLTNMLGLCLGVLMLLQVVATRDLSFLRTRQVLIFAGIGLVFLLATLYASTLFPTLEASRATNRFGSRMIDRTETMTNEFVTRLLYLLFILAFVRTRQDLQLVFGTFVLTFFIAVPSALLNWAQGELVRGFRAAASVTAGTNANKLAMVCLIEVVCLWCWSAARPGLGRRLVALAGIAASVLTLLGTGSRSGLLGAGVTLLILASSPGRFRVGPAMLGAATALALLAMVTVAPPLAVERMMAFMPATRGAVGASSLELREQTIDKAMTMFRDHPLTGVGLGNFREVARQVYYDDNFRPPHNSFLWALAEGGIGALLGYLLLFGVTWLDLRWIRRHAHRDPELEWMGVALQGALVITVFFSLFADIWLMPITYLLVGLAVTLRRRLASLPEPVLARPVRAPRLPQPPVPSAAA